VPRTAQPAFEVFDAAEYEHVYLKAVSAAENS